MWTKSQELLTWRGPGIGHTALHWAAAKGHLALVQWLLSTGVPVDIRNAENSTALHSAAANGELACVQVGGTSAKLLILRKDRPLLSGREEEDPSGPKSLRLAAKGNTAAFTLCCHFHANLICSPNRANESRAVPVG